MNINELDSPQLRLKYFVTKAYKKQKDFAKDLGVTPQSLYVYLNDGGSIYTSADKQKKLEELGLNINWYLTGEGEMQLDKEKEQVQSNAEFTDVKGTVKLPVIKEMTKEEKIKAREVLKDYLNLLNDSLVEELI
jgi:transcriptional regulator with XRE-family HTH domain